MSSRAPTRRTPTSRASASPGRRPGAARGWTSDCTCGGGSSPAAGKRRGAALVASPLSVDGQRCGSPLRLGAPLVLVLVLILTVLVVALLRLPRRRATLAGRDIAARWRGNARGNEPRRVGRRLARSWGSRSGRRGLAGRDAAVAGGRVAVARRE